MAYGSNDQAQIIAYGAANSDYDTSTDTARQTATSIINSQLNLEEDIKAPSKKIDDCCNLLAAAIISTSPEATAQSAFWIAGMKMLDNLPDNSADAPWRINIPVDRFRSVANNSIVGNNF